MNKVGWAGAGRMGTPMATRLVRAGVDVLAWNRTPQKLGPVLDAGAAAAAELTDLGDREVVFTMLATPAAVEEVLGALGDGPSRIRIVVDCSTIDVDTSRTLRERLAEVGVALLSAPVSGNAHAVESGQLSVAVSGARAAYEEVRPLLEHLGPSVTYMGPTEEARVVKIAHNLLLGIVTQGLAEITVLAEKAGIGRAELFGFLNDSVLGSTFTRYKTAAFVDLDRTVTFTPPLLQKDFDLGLAAARRLNVPLPLVSTTAQLVGALVARGHLEDDFAVLLDQQAESAGLSLTTQPVGVTS